MRPARTRTRPASKQQVAARVVSLGLLVAWQLSMLQIAPTSQTAVVRPTVFSDLNAAPADAASQQPAPPAQQHPASTDGAPQAPQQQSAPGTKINPLKSRFCSGAAAPLGLQSLALDDLALSASSYSNEQVGPHLARLNLDISGGAWCPMKPISGSNFGKEWIQAKLNRSFVVSAIETQGRFGMGNGKEFVPSYQVEYSRNAGQTWHKWKDFRGSSLLRANEDVNTAVRNELSPPIVGANVIRILPYSQHLRTVCLRFELHGCPYDEGAPIAYATSDGVVEPRWGHLIDYTYDGLRQRGQLSHGLGQLVDGVKGHDNFSHNSGFEWVGWKSMNGDVVIEFTFKTLRNFTGALFHSNNLFSSGVEVFQAVDIHYGIELGLSVDALRDALEERRRRELAATWRAGNARRALAGPEVQAAPEPGQTLWSPDVLSIEYEPDKKVESSRPVTVHLKHRLANRLRFVLKFASKWILVSEVEFLSHPVELLSLASISEQQTPELLAALGPAKSYDEFVAILREHQLRRIATSAYLESFAGNGNANANGSAPAQQQPQQPEASDQPPAGEPANPPPATIYDDYLAAGKRVTGPAIPSMVGPMTTTNALWQQPLDSQAPATSPVLSFSPQAPNMIYSAPDTATMIRSQGELASAAANRKDGASPTSLAEPAKSTLGLATVISFVLVTILVILGALFAISSYRLRQHPKLSSPLARHLAAPAPKAGLCTPCLQSIMNVFSSSTGRGHHQSASDNHYNAIFAPSTQRPPIEPVPASARAASTLKRLATLTGSSAHKTAHPFLVHHQPGQPGQLMVSVKDNHTGTVGPTTLFGHHAGANNKLAGSAQSSQLIVGLNQANPLAQQQIYNNSSNLNCSNQTYATHYSTSMSMASSSTTTGNQGDYADYAIPDAQPMIPASSELAGSQHHRHHLQPHPAGHHLHQQQHLNHAFNSSFATGHLFKAPFGYQTELRASHRAPQTSLIQPQQLITQHQQPRVVEHNYDFIYQTDPLCPRPETSQHQASSNNNNNIRTIGNQFASCQPQFSTMTLGHNKFQQQQQQLQQQQQQQQHDLSKRVEESDSSPGGSSNQSGATTITTSANSSNGTTNDLASLNRYHYASDATSAKLNRG